MESTTQPVAPSAAAGDSVRIAGARVRVQQRQQRQAHRLRPLTWLMLAVIGVCAWTGSVRPGLSGTGLALSIALACYALPLMIAGGGRWPADPPGWRLALALLLSVGGLAVAALDPDGALADIPVSGAVMLTFLQLELRRAVLVGGTTTVLLAVLLALTSDSPVESATSGTLFCVVLAVTAELIRRSRESQARTELLLAELEDAREAETRAAADAERARIAGELHDVLAQSLSALSIQLEGARRLGEREQVSPLLQQVIERSVELTREGLNEARHAVGALRGDRLPALEDLEPLVERCRRDLELTVALSVLGTPWPCDPDAGFALYRGVQEALTNVARYARGAATEIVLDYRAGGVLVTVSNGPGQAPPSGSSGGGGNGLRGMRERIERAGGRAEAGPADTGGLVGGWRVVMEVPG
ncbi:signal transduction histidine kinase [Kitasatospora sp. MAP12-15]|uniref:sensor histidine kinase n=1 Tax=unclassified Kitasatospora TaxID=2633591 RepID=UPI002475669C|nr:histidine kinase [Kitasatospora sp. MAP12-44]MDH6111284.1 signal transduction histidine kinase [Kitasatospora sp. MAP12-44]